MLNSERRRQFADLIRDSGWDVLVLYGHAWRKDFFRSLVNFNFFGPHAVAALTRSGEISVVFSHPWDYEVAAKKIDASFAWKADFAEAVRNLSSGKAAIAGREFMEARFVDETTVSATAAIEKLRRIKTPGEIESIKKAAALADAGYQYFFEAVSEGLAEYELAAEVEGFLKRRGAEDNAMLIASGGAEVFGMHPPTQRQLRAGDNVLAAIIPQCDGFSAQICRTITPGQPCAEQIRSFAIFRDAEAAAQRFIRPGVNIRDAARAQKDVFTREGFGDDAGGKYTSACGRNIGLYPDGNPLVLKDVDCDVAENMVLITHLNAYTPLSGAQVLGDTLLVTHDGCVSLSQTEKKLFSRETR